MYFCQPKQWYAYWAINGTLPDSARRHAGIAECFKKNILRNDAITESRRRSGGLPSMNPIIRLSRRSILVAIMCLYRIPEGFNKESAFVGGRHLRLIWIEDMKA